MSPPFTPEEHLFMQHHIVRLPALVEHIASMERAILRHMPAQPVYAERCLTRLCVVIDEVFSNICRYAYPGGTNGPNRQGDMAVCFDIPGAAVLGQVRFWAIDWGVPFDPSAAVAALAPRETIEKRTPGKLGLAFIHHFCELLEYERAIFLEGEANLLRVTFQCHT